MLRFTEGAVHFIGIGGIGMSALARILHEKGYVVTGSDKSENATTHALQALGIAIQHHHDPDAVCQASLVIKSSAIQESNPELHYALSHHIPVLHRSELLAMVMEPHRTIAVTGAHGKTTTTAIIGLMLRSASLHPCIIVGGYMNQFNSPIVMDSGEWMVVEADESDGSFTRLPRDIAVITNIDREHMDYYGTTDRLLDYYRQFCAGVRPDGLVVIGIDSPMAKILALELTRPHVTYGKDPDAMIRYTNVRHTAEGQQFDVIITREGEQQVVSNLLLPTFGQHNLVNVLAGIAVALYLHHDEATIRQAIGSFTGVKRRLTPVGEVDGVLIIDDYAHHPAEILATLEAIRMLADTRQGRVFAALQPHRYTRLADLMEPFATALLQADRSMILPLYAASEAPMDGVNSTALHARVLSLNPDHRCDVVQDEKAMAAIIEAECKPGDVVVIMGAGSSSHMAHSLVPLLASAMKEAS